MNRNQSTSKLDHLLDQARLGEIDATKFYRALLEGGDLTPLERIKCTRDAFGLTIEDAKRLAYEIEGLSDEKWVIEMITALHEPYDSQSDDDTEDYTDRGRR